MMPSASSRCRPRVSSRFQRAHSFVRTNTVFRVRSHFLFRIIIIQATLGVQHNQTLSAIRIWYRINVTLEGAFNTIRDTEYQ